MIVIKSNRNFRAQLRNGRCGPQEEKERTQGLVLNWVFGDSRSGKDLGMTARSLYSKNPLDILQVF